MSVQQGMDVDRVRQIAGQLEANSEALAGISASGRSQLSVLAGAWAGPDLDKFGGSWATAERTLAEASSTVRRLSQQLTEQAGEQDETSEGTGSVLGTPGGPGETPYPRNPTPISGTSEPWAIPGLDTLGNILGPIGVASSVNKIVKAMPGGGPGLHALLARVPALTRPVLSPGARLGLFMQADLTHPLLSRAAANVFGSSKMAPLFNASRLGALTKFTKGLGVVGVGLSGYDLIAGAANRDWSQAISGGLGVASVAVPALLALTGPAGWAVGGGLALGSFVVSQWGDEIGAGAKAAWDWTGDRLADVGGAAKDVVSDLGDSAKGVVEDVGSVLSDPPGSVKGLFS